MSRIGKRPILIPKDVNVDIKGDLLVLKGPLGELQRRLHPDVRVSTSEGQIVVSIDDSSKRVQALHGLYRALIANMVTGVSKGFERILDIVGVGYRAELSGRTATFHLGYSHPILFELPKGIDAKIERTRITLKGIDRELLGALQRKRHQVCGRDYSEKGRQDGRQIKGRNVWNMK